MIVYPVPYRKLLAISLVALWVMLLSQSAFGQDWSFRSADSAEKVSSALVTAITSGQTITPGSPYKVAVTLGDGAKFKRILTTNHWMILTCAPQAESPLTNIEEFYCSAVSNDTLTLVQRHLSNTTAHTWPIGSTIAYRLTALALKELQDSINYMKTTGAGPGTVTSIIFNAPLTGGTITSTGTVSIPQATASTNGYLTSSDWATFFGRQTVMSGIAPITISGGNSIGITQASSGQSGYLTLTDWNTFNNKMPYADSTGKTRQVWTVLAGGGLGWSSAGSGTVSSVNVDGGLSGLTFANGPITNTGTISLSGGVLALSYGGTGAGTAAQALVNIITDTTGKTGKYLRVKAGGGIVWDTASGSGGGGSGSVTSVDMTVPSFLSVAGAPITSAGTLALTLSGTALPYSSGGTGQTSWTKGDLLHASATNTLAKLGIGTTGQALVVSGGDVAWGTVGTVTSVGASGPSGIMTWSSALTGSGTLTATLASQTANTFLGAPDGSSGTPSFRALVVADIPALDVSQITSGAFPVANGGTGRSSLTNHSLLVGASTAAVTQLGVATNGQIPIGSTGADPVLATITAGAGISVTNGAGSITVAATGLLTNPMTTTGDIIYSSDNSGTPARRGIGTSGQFLLGGTTPTWGNTLNQNGIAATTTLGLLLQNSTAATSGVPVQQSPTLEFDSHVWNTSPTAHDSELDARVTFIGTSSTITTARLSMTTGNTSLGFTERMSVSSANILDLPVSTASYSINGTTMLTTFGRSDAVFIGGSGKSTLSSSDNYGFGRNVLTALTSGQDNVGYGGESGVAGGALGHLTSGSENTAYGCGALRGITTQSFNTSIGWLSGGPTGASNCVFLGAGAGSTTANSVSNSFFCGSAGHAITDVYFGDGDFAGSAAAGDSYTIHGTGGNGTNKAGGAVTIAAGLATGNAASGSIFFKSAIAGATGTTSQSLIEVGRFDSLHLILANPLQETSGGVNQSSYSTGDMLYASASNTLSKRTIGTTNDILTVAGGVPTWSSSATLTNLTLGGNLSLSEALNLYVVGVVASTRTMTPTECVVPCDATGAGFTLTLAPSPTVGQFVVVSKTDITANAVTVAPNSGQSIVAGTGVLTGGNLVLNLAAPTGTFIYVGGNVWILTSRI
jgi:hypothetical protein